jgi:tRNA/rRNA methyltransferase
MVDTLDEALDGISHLCATAMTPRDFGPPTRTPREHFEMLMKGELDVRCRPAQAVQCLASGVAAAAESRLPPLQPDRRGLLFGCERFGMSNEDVYRCDVALSIPSNPQFGSLNLGAAIQVVAYDWRQALGGFPWWSTRPSRSAPMWRRWAACWALGEALAHIGFLDPAAPKKLMPRLNQLVQPRAADAGGNPHPARCRQTMLRARRQAARLATFSSTL